MDREKLFRHLEQRYTSKRDMISRIPLGVQPDALWQELLNQRRSHSTVLPLYSCKGTPFWYVTTDKMVAASEKIVEALLENDIDFDPCTEVPTVSTLEEVFYTSYVEGSPMTMQAAMDFLTGGSPPRDIEEQLITNNRLAGSYAGANLYRPVETGFLRELAEILTDGMDSGGGDLRTDDRVCDAPASEEQFVFPPARDIPNRLSELTAFLASPLTHPLIKAAAAQAYIMVLRPFPDGNERLGRILSGMILLRAGYTFFSDVSLSALIARKSYGYYEAIANILREENGGDMTYFLEYFMELLSRAVDERRLRLSQKEDLSRQAEQELARTPLAPAPLASDPLAPDNLGDDLIKTIPLTPASSPPFPPDGGPGGKKRNARDSITSTARDSITSTARDSITSTARDGTETAEPDIAHCDASVMGCRGYQDASPTHGPEDRPVQNIYGKLTSCFVESPNSTVGLLARFMMEMLHAGKLMFSIDEAAASLNLSPRQFCMAIRRMKEHGLIQLFSKLPHHTYYRICAVENETDQPYTLNASGTPSSPSVSGQVSSDSGQLLPPSFPDQDISSIYDHDILDQINALERSNSSKDKRIAELIHSCLPRGEITADDYEAAGELSKWSTDMLLAAQLGLVKKISPRRYAILHTLKTGPLELSKGQRRFITEMYENFGDDVFSSEMVVATLDYSGTHIKAWLHQFTLLRILDCRKEDVFRYQFLINPEENPEYFDIVA